VKTALLAASILVIGFATFAGQGKILASDPLTNLPLIPATSSGMEGADNAPTQLPAGNVCKSKMQGEYFMLFKIKVDATVAWYSSHLTGFKKFQGYASDRSQTVFYNSDGTIVVSVTGEPGAQGVNTDGYSVTYERFQPGLSEKTITSLAQGKVVCQ
jgi:hypothetical protein